MTNAIYEREILKELITSSGIISPLGRVRPTKITPDLLERIRESTVGCRDFLAERVYWILNDITDYPRCEECHAQFIPRFFGAKHGYWGRTFCSAKCVDKSEKIKAQRANTYFERTGYTNVAHNPEAKLRREQTNIERYGAANPFQSAQIIEKIAADRLIRTGYAHQSQNPEVHSRQHQHRTRTHVLESGKIVKYQGFELTALLKLFDLYSEEDVKNFHDGVPSIQYWYNEKNRWYFPDIYVPSENLIIEVKSTWTYGSKDKNQGEYWRNQAKAKATIDAGYNFQFWICDRKQVLHVIDAAK